MKKYFYSASTNSFFDGDLRYSTFPVDAISIPESLYQSIQSLISTSEVELYADEKGYPATRPIVMVLNEPDPKEQALALLKNTDWYVIRAMEIGTAIPGDIREAREAARAILGESSVHE